MLPAHSIVTSLTRLAKYAKMPTFNKEQARMKQILLNSSGALIARMPAPSATPGNILIKVHYSMISPGTELASLRTTSTAQTPNVTPIAKAKNYTNLARMYLGKAIRDPQKAAERLRLIARRVKAKAFAAVATNAAPDELSAEEMDVQADEMLAMGWNVGYSAAGEVIAVGDGINDIAPGELVACAGAGCANHAEYISVPRNLVCPIPSGCDVKAAASTTLGTIALQGIRQAQPTLGETIVVIGLGLLGQLTIQMLRANGCYVIGMDLSAERVQRALDLGMNAGCSDNKTLVKLINNATQGHGADRTLITAATKSDHVINSAMEITRRKGTVVIVGDVGLHVKRQHFYKKEITLLISSSYGPGRYDPSYEEQGRDYPYAYVRWTSNRNMQAYMELIARGQINIDKIIDKTITLDEAPATYKQLLNDRKQSLLGVMIEYPQETMPSPQPADATLIRLHGHRKPQRDKINYILVGAGAFGTAMLVPQMAKCDNLFFLQGIVSRDAVRGGNYVRTHQLEIFASELAPVLTNDDCDLLVIATRHCDHAKQVIAGLQANKHIFVEKPLALTWEELHEINETYSALTNPPLLMVGFNRRFSPAMQKLKRILTNRTSPLMINYRLNGGYIKPDHWIQNQQGGGRNLGEACHMYDCFRYLADAPVNHITAQAITPGKLPYLKNDNFIATLGYEDGSIANLMYTALGPKQGLPKEYIEVFVDGEAYILDDYQSLTRASDGTVLWRGDTDKGHFNELLALGKAIKQQQAAPIPYAEIIETTAVALRIDDLIFNKETIDNHE